MTPESLTFTRRIEECGALCARARYYVFIQQYDSAHRARRKAEAVWKQAEFAQALATPDELNMLRHHRRELDALGSQIEQLTK
jgi:hypothetical protein